MSPVLAMLHPVERPAKLYELLYGINIDVQNMRRKEMLRHA